MVNIALNIINSLAEIPTWEGVIQSYYNNKRKRKHKEMISRKNGR